MEQTRKSGTLEPNLQGSHGNYVFLLEAFSSKLTYFPFKKNFLKSAAFFFVPPARFNFKNDVGLS